MEAPCNGLLMKIIYMKCGVRDEYLSDLRNDEHYLSTGENKA